MNPAGVRSSHLTKYILALLHCISIMSCTSIELIATCSPESPLSTSSPHTANEVVFFACPSQGGIPSMSQDGGHTRVRKRRHESFMYFPTSIARQFCTVPSLPNAPLEPVLRITPSPHKSLFCALTRDGVAIWRVRVCGLLLCTCPLLIIISR